MTTTRLDLYAHAVRNGLGRRLGASWTYTPAQLLAAQQMWSVFLKEGFDDDTSAACIGCSEGEASLLFPAPRGDRGEAGGGYQWHNPRRAVILNRTGIDVWGAEAGDTARAFIAEISNRWGAPYDQVRPALLAAESIPAKMQVLLAQFERSGNQPRDLARRVPMAQAWRQRIDAWRAGASS